MSDVENGIRNAFGFAAEIAQEQIGWVGLQWSRPSTVHRPMLTKDGNAWIALLGENIQVGVVGCGASPAEAMDNFDREFYAKETQPVTPPLAMSEELERVLQRAEEDARTCWQTKAPGRLADIAAVRQQATAPKVVKTPRVPVDSIRCLLARGSWPDRDDESYTAQKNAVAWLAELDAHEGRKP